MKLNKLWAALLATSFGLAATMSPTIADAQNNKKAAPAAPAAAKKAVKKGIVIEPAGVRWGMSMKQVGEVIDAMLDAEYKPIYQKTGNNGVESKRLDAALAEEKNAFRRSRIDFGKLPVATDSTALKGEYSYLNGESMMTLTRKGEPTRHFFFIKDSLWKIIKEVKFSKEGELGKDFKEAAVKLTATFGSPGRVIPPNEAKQIYTTSVDWKDGTTHVRLLERSEASCAVALEDQQTAANIDSLRVNKPKQEEAVDPAVAAALRGPDPEPTKAADPKATTTKKTNKK